MSETSDNLSMSTPDADIPRDKDGLPSNAGFRRAPEWVKIARSWAKYIGAGSGAVHVLLDVLITILSAIDGALVVVAKKYDAKGADNTDTE